jgi:hypothetical protein
VIDFTTIKSEITAFIPTLSGLPAAAIRWRDEAGGSTWAQGASLWMRLQNTSRIGIEEEFREDRPLGADQTVTLVGQRHFLWNIRAESFEQDIASHDFAGNIADRVAIRLMRSTSIFARTAFGIVHRHPTQFFSYKESGRQVSCYVLDILCITKDTDIDTTEGAGDWIGSARVYGDVDGVREVDEIITGDV